MTDPIPVQHIRHYGAVYPQAWKQAAEMRKVYERMPDRKTWCYLPVNAAATIALAEAQKQGAGEEVSAMDASNLAAVINWRMGQGIYRFDEELYRVLWSTPLTGRLPVDPLFRLPAWCVWIDTPQDPILNSPGFFGFVDHDLDTGRAELRFSISTADGKSLQPQILHLTEDTLEDCIEAAYQQGIRIGAERGVLAPELKPKAVEAGAQIAQLMRQIVAPRLSLMLYLCVENAEVFDARTGQRRPEQPRPIKDKKGERYVAASLPTAWDVGERIGAAIRRAKERRERSEYQGGTHRSAIPHWRKPHWQAYWRGEGRTERFVRLKMSFPVGYGDANSGDGPAVIHDAE